MPRPMVTESESTVRTGISPWTDLAAIWADWPVAESCEEMVMHTTPSAPAAAARRYASSKAPADGADVSGRTGEVAHRAQNSLGERSRRSTSSSPPKRMVRGTMSMSSSATRSAGRSQLLSVTTRGPAMSAPLFGDGRRADADVVPVLGGPKIVQDVRPRLLGQRDTNSALAVNVEGGQL